MYGRSTGYGVLLHCPVFPWPWLLSRQLNTLTDQWSKLLLVFHIFHAQPRALETRGWKRKKKQVLRVLFRGRGAIRRSGRITLFITDRTIWPQVTITDHVTQSYAYARPPLRVAASFSQVEQPLTKDLLAMKVGPASFEWRWRQDLRDRLFTVQGCGSFCTEMSTSQGTFVIDKLSSLKCEFITECGILCQKGKKNQIT